MSVELILKTVSDRWSIEEHFHDVKEIWGAGEQQVRKMLRETFLSDLANCDVYWFEEAIQPDALDDYVLLREHSPIAIAKHLGIMNLL